MLRIFKVKLLEATKIYPERISISERLDGVKARENYVMENRNYRYQNTMDQAFALLTELGINVTGYNVQPCMRAGYIVSDSVGENQVSLRGTKVNIESLDNLKL